MRRHRATPRTDWQKTVESQGLHFHTSDDGTPYWDEGAYYEFRAAEIDAIERATYALDKMCLAAVQRVLDENLLERFLIPPEFRGFIRNSWENDEQTLYGRFDLAFDGQEEPKLLEYNADTPTALLEAAAIQWFWLKDVFPRSDQFNSIHERLLETWGSLKGQLPRRVYFASLGECIEDAMTVTYLRDTAMQAGLDTAPLNVEDIGWNAGRRVFTDLDEVAIAACFKLYPWEWMFRETFGEHLLQTQCRWLEPPWKAILSNKAILPILWEMYPESPYLLRASFEPLPEGNYVRKPIFGREGANIQVFERGQLFLKTEGPYEGPAVYQEVFPLPRFEGKFFPVIGSWMVGGWACGIGVREDENLITGNLSRFVPHIF
jgi:glutathionylspermidine synthase